MSAISGVVERHVGAFLTSLDEKLGVSAPSSALDDSST